MSAEPFQKYIADEILVLKDDIYEAIMVLELSKDNTIECLNESISNYGENYERHKRIQDNYREETKRTDAIIAKLKEYKPTWMNKEGS